MVSPQRSQSREANTVVRLTKHHNPRELLTHRLLGFTHGSESMGLGRSPTVRISTKFLGTDATGRPGTPLI